LPDLITLVEPVRKQSVRPIFCSLLKALNVCFTCPGRDILLTLPPPYVTKVWLESSLNYYYTAARDVSGDQLHVPVARGQVRPVPARDHPHLPGHNRKLRPEYSRGEFLPVA